MQSITLALVITDENKMMDSFVDFPDFTGKTEDYSRWMKERLHPLLIRFWIISWLYFTPRFLTNFSLFLAHLWPELLGRREEAKWKTWDTRIHLQLLRHGGDLSHDFMWLLSGILKIAFCGLAKMPGIRPFSNFYFALSDIILAATHCAIEASCLDALIGSYEKRLEKETDPQKRMEIVRYLKQLQKAATLIKLQGLLNVAGDLIFYWPLAGFCECRFFQFLLLPSFSWQAVYSR